MPKSKKKHRSGMSKQPKDHPPKAPAPPIPTRTLELHQGPLPHPSILEEYDRILPGAAERILTMAEIQSSHRQKLEERALKTESRNSLLGIICGGIIGLCGIILAGICIYSGKEWGGIGLGGATLCSLVGTFIYGTKQRRFEREQKYGITRRS